MPQSRPEYSPHEGGTTRPPVRAPYPLKPDTTGLPRRLAQATLAQWRAQKAKIDQAYALEVKAWDAAQAARAAEAEAAAAAQAAATAAAIAASTTSTENNVFQKEHFTPGYEKPAIRMGPVSVEEKEAIVAEEVAALEAQKPRYLLWAGGIAAAAALLGVLSIGLRR